MAKLFGTDGIRGVANADLTPELAFAVGRAGATVLAHTSDRHRPIVIGRDTRLSGTMLEAAITAGMTSIGRDVISIGIMPTPAVARVTIAERAAAGVMISASHNPVGDNGIKFFGPDGFKLSDEIESEIESLIESSALPRPTGTDIGVASLAANLGKHYYNELTGIGVDLHGLHVVVDGAYGAAYAVAPYVLRKLGAVVTEINCENDGARINVECGATHIEALQTKVRELLATGANAVGVAFDGDADRALFVDETGAVVSGDHVMFAIGRDLHERGELPGDAIVGTVMSNIGLERSLARHGIALLRAPVGDRYVLERMRAGDYRFGGEQSGHIIDLRRNTTGDGPMTAVTLFGIQAAGGKRLHDLVSEIVVAPQVLVNVRTPRREVLDDLGVREAIARAQERLEANGGRLLIRPSGTEPLIRVMAEGDDRSEIERVAADLARHIDAAAKGL